MTTTREIFACCSKCSGTFEIEASIVEQRTMIEVGFALVDGVWMGLCPACEKKRTAASNAEYEALVRAAAQIGRIDKAGPLRTIEIPTAEGFELEGEKHFGFWAVSGNYTDADFEVFQRAARLIVDRLNVDRGTRLLVNVNGNKTQAIVHGLVE